jgi:hypothetical protein
MKSRHEAFDDARFMRHGLLLPRASFLVQAALLRGSGQPVTSLTRSRVTSTVRELT